MEDSARLSVGEMFALIGAKVGRGVEGLPFPAHVATDSRDVERGGVFVALEGERTDGHRYVPQALEKGAALIVVRRGKRPEDPAVPCVELEDPERDLARLASAYLRRTAPEEVVAVTGSVGKTTTREALRRVLRTRFRVHSADRSLNTRIGCTATVLAMPPDAELLLLEFGANKAGEIAELSELFPPTTAMVTQVAPVHLEGFRSVEGVLRAKMEIAGSGRLRRFLYNFDNPLLRGAAAGLSGPSVDSVGMECGADFLIEEPRFTLEGVLPFLTFRLRGGGDEACIRSGLWGRHLALPLAFAAAAGCRLGIPLREGAAALEGFRGIKGRGRILPAAGREGFVVDDAYNANPLSMRSSLETFLSLRSVTHKMAVLGEMREMGPDAVRYHRELEPLIDGVDEAVLVGELWRGALEEKPNRRFVGGWREALDAARAAEWVGILVKGSNSLELERVVEGLAAEPVSSDGPGEAS